MKHNRNFGANLGAYIQQAYYEKYKDKICYVCKKKVSSLLIYNLHPYLLENGGKLKKSKIGLLRKIDTNKVCIVCHKKLLNLEEIYITAIKNNCRSYAELFRLRLECSDKIEWYWS